MYESGPNSDSALLQLSGLTVAVGGRELFSGMDLELAAGSLVAISGPSGCGKSTFLRTVNGLIDAPRGTVQLQNRTPAQIGWPEFRRQVVLVEQQPVLLTASVEFNLMRPFTFQQTQTQYSASRARHLLDRLGMASVTLSEPAQSLSVGQQQRLSLIRALLIDPKVVLLDEPTSALDARAAARVTELVTETAQQSGLAAIVVTHAPEQAQQWCDDLVDLTPFCTMAPGQKDS